jgi:hypothetical protein
VANAIHKTGSSGDTLQTVAQAYYAIIKPNGEVDRVQQRIIIQAIRKATPVSVTDLTSVADNATLVDKTLFIPTLRKLNRALLVVSTLPAGLLAAFKDKGILHARKLLRRKVEDVVALMAPTYSEADVRKAYVITQFFNLDGMDRYTAAHLYESQGIDTLAELGQQSPATLLTILQGLLNTPYLRPTQLTQQKHEERWPREARIYGRPRRSESSKAHWTRPFVVHVPPGHARASAEHHERIGRRTDLDLAAQRAARATSVLFRFQEQVLRGHQALLSGKYRKSVGHYESARQTWHGWLLQSGVVTSPVNEKVGVSLNTAITGVKRLLEALPDEDEEDPEAPVQPGGRSGRARGLGVRGFKYTELTSAARSELNTELNSKKVRLLPKEFRRAISRQVLEKTRTELSTADANLTQGLSAAAGDVLVRDFDSEDRQRVVRNLGATSVSTLGTSGLGLLDQAPVQDALHVAGVKAIVAGSFWSSATAIQKLESTAMAKYPSWLASESPFTRFVVLPALEGQSVAQVLRLRGLDTDFQTDWTDQFLKDRVKSPNTEDRLPPRAVWEVPAVFALWIPVLYGKIVPQGLSLAHAKLGLSHVSGPEPVYQKSQVNTYNSAGTLVGPNRHALAGSDLKMDSDLNLLSSSNPLPSGVDTFMTLLLWTTNQGAEADRLYAIGDLASARSLYQDLVTGIEIFEPAVDYDLDASMVGLAEQAYNSPFSGASHLWEVDENSNQRLGGILYERRDPPQLSPPLEDAAAVADEHFLFDAVPSTAALSMSSKTSVTYDTLLENNFVADNGYFGTLGWSLDESEEKKAHIWSQYLHFKAMIAQIDLGLNILGYRTDYIPPWSAEHLYGVARDLCNRALEAEQRVQSLIQLQESATAEELVAGNNVANSAAQLQVAVARLNEQLAQNTLATQQAQLSALQTQIAERENNSQLFGKISQSLAGIARGVGMGTNAGLMVGTAVLPGIGTAVGGVIGAAVGAIPGVYGIHHAVSIQSLYESASTQADAIVESTKQLAAASVALATAEYDAANTRLAGDMEYARYLTEERILNAEAYAQLISIAQQVAEAYLSEAIRLSWLAQRALAHETRRSMDIVLTSYTEEDAVTDLTRAQKLTADLELLRASYVAGETARRQEVRVTLSLRELQPGALGELQKTGECVFVIQQEMVDRAFPGLYLHSLQEMQITFVGTLPPEGPRGTLVTLGKTKVRVPNDAAFFDGSVLETDWAVARLAGVPGPYANWAGYRMKHINTQGTVLTLSEFDVTGDRAVLHIPQGMLGAVALIGMDNAWMLRLHAQSNRFPWSAIRDMEISLWFLAAYDADLEGAQSEAIRLKAESDENLQGTLLVSAAQSTGSMWGSFVRNATSESVVDVRYLVFDRGDYAPSEARFASKRLTNLYLGTPLDQEIVLRLLCTDDPVGILVTTKYGSAFTYLAPPWNTIPTFPAATDPEPNRQPDGGTTTPTGLTKWVRDTFFSAVAEPNKVPNKAPSPRWVIKVVPDKANPAGGQFEWRAKDADGNLIRSTHGALSSGAGGLATWEGSTALTHVRLAAKLKTNGGRIRMLLRRVNATNEYRFVLDTNSAKISRVVGGTASDLQSKSLSYPTDEWLYAVFDAYGDGTSTTLRVEIDGIEILKATDASSPHVSGRVGFDINSAPSPFELDDVSVVRLSKLGLAQETLLEEPFSSTTLPSTWSFTNGTPAWAVSTTGHTYAALSKLEDVVLRMDYGFKP